VRHGCELHAAADCRSKAGFCISDQANGKLIIFRPLAFL